MKGLTTEGSVSQAQSRDISRMLAGTKLTNQNFRAYGNQLDASKLS